MVSHPPSADTSSSQSPNMQDGADRPSVNNKPLDIVFLQDTTGSQGPYIIAARKAIRDICDKIAAAGELAKGQLRFGLIAFRDHPPQDKTYVTKSFGFTSDIGIMQENLASLIASGGGDGPEAQTAALADALNLEWSKDAVKLVILITDSPPHGLGEAGDGFSESPDQNDPLEIVRQMAERGITLFVVACEPSLSQQYMHALDFYKALTQITSGQVFPLLMADKLGDYIVGTAIETIETEKLIGEFEKVIVNDVYNNAMPVEKVAENLQQFMNEKGRKINTIAVEDIYVPNAQAETNSRVWGGANKISDARAGVRWVREPRIQAQFLAASSNAIGGSYGGSARSRFGPGPPSRGKPPPPLMAKAAPGATSYRGSVAFGGLKPAAPMPMASAAPIPMASVPFYSGPTQLQQVSLGSQQVSQMQAQRIVTQSIARNSKVTAAGMFSKASGQAATMEAKPST